MNRITQQQKSKVCFWSAPKKVDQRTFLVWLHSKNVIHLPEKVSCDFMLFKNDYIEHILMTAIIYACFKHQPDYVIEGRMQHCNIVSLLTLSHSVVIYWKQWPIVTKIHLHSFTLASSNLWKYKSDQHNILDLIEIKCELRRGKAIITSTKSK